MWGSVGVATSSVLVDSPYKMTALARNTVSHSWGRGSQEDEEEGMIEEEKDGLWNNARKRPRSEGKMGGGLSKTRQLHKSELSSSQVRSSWDVSKSQKSSTSTRIYRTMCQNFVGRRDYDCGPPIRQKSRSRSRSPNRRPTSFDRRLRSPDRVIDNAFARREYRAPPLSSSDGDRSYRPEALTGEQMRREPNDRSARNGNKNLNPRFDQKQRGNWEDDLDRSNRMMVHTPSSLEPRQQQRRSNSYEQTGYSTRDIRETRPDPHFRNPVQIPRERDWRHSEGFMQSQFRPPAPEERSMDFRPNMRNHRDYYHLSSCRDSNPWRRSERRTFETSGDYSGPEKFPSNNHQASSPAMTQAFPSPRPLPPTLPPIRNDGPKRYSHPINHSGAPSPRNTASRVDTCRSTPLEPSSLRQNQSYLRNHSGDRKRHVESRETRRNQEVQHNTPPAKKRWWSKETDTLEIYPGNTKIHTPFSTAVLTQPQHVETVAMVPFHESPTKTTKTNVLPGQRTTSCSPSQPSIAAVSQAMTSSATFQTNIVVGCTTGTSSTTVNEPPPAPKTTIGIPMRWLKPAVKPKIVKKAATLVEQPILPKKKRNDMTRIQDAEPLSPLTNRVVTDSEGGSTVSNTRDLVAMMEKKPKSLEVPAAIITKPKAEYASLDSPPATDDEVKVKKMPKMKANADRIYAFEDDETDVEPHLESDNDNSTDSSSDDSDTDEEEVMLWASKMFGIPKQQIMAHESEIEARKDNFEATSRKPLKLRLKLSHGRILADTPRPVSTSSIAASYEENKPLYKQAKNVRQMQARCEEDEGVYIDQPVKLAVRGRRKLQKSYLKKLPDMTQREREVDLEQERIERQEEKRIREEAKPLTTDQIREILGEEDFQSATSATNWVRRSVRQPCRALLDSKPLKALVAGLKTNSPDMVVLKMKKYVNDPNAPSVVLDAALEALEENTTCEALYIQVSLAILYRVVSLKQITNVVDFSFVSEFQ